MVIPGSADADHVRSNVLAPTQSLPLSPEAVGRRRELGAHGSIHGTFNGSA